MAVTFTLTSLVALASLSGSAFGAPSPAPVNAVGGDKIAARATCVSTYTSVAGDTCSSIASKYGLTSNDILNANTFLNCNDIWTNTPICIVAPTCSSTYTSLSGDTCDSIASKFGVTSAAIQAANTFLTCNDIWTNTPICVPAGGSTTTTTTTTTTASGSTPTCASTYTSLAGDTCDSIASKFGVTSAAVLSANSFLDCSNIWTNTPICVPAGGSTNSNGGGSSGSGSSGSGSCVMTYISAAGDTCNSIAGDFGLSASTIQNYNSFLDCNNIWTDTPICVPSGGQVAVPQAGSAADCVVTYTSGAGDTCDTIANKFGLLSTDVQDANSFVTCNNIWTGTPLCIISGCS